MTELEIRKQILLDLAELYEDPSARRQFKRFEFKDNDERLARKILDAMAKSLVVDKSEGHVVRLTDFGYEFIGEELERMRGPTRNEAGGKGAAVRWERVPGLRSGLILIVDDFRDDRELYRHFLQLKGFQIAIAVDGPEALSRTAEVQPDLIIMDLGLPGMGGWEVIRRLKGDAATRQIPILVLTARAFITAKAVGSDGCLIKPCLPDRLLAEVDRLLATDRASSPSISAGMAPPGN